MSASSCSSASSSATTSTSFQFVKLVDPKDDPIKADKAASWNAKADEKAIFIEICLRGLDPQAVIKQLLAQQKATLEIENQTTVSLLLGKVAEVKDCTDPAFKRVESRDWSGAINFQIANLKKAMEGVSQTEQELKECLSTELEAIEQQKKLRESRQSTLQDLRKMLRKKRFSWEIEKPKSI